MSKIEIELRKKTPEQIQSQCVVLTIENIGLRGCLESVMRDLHEILQVAQKVNFIGDMFVLATANNAIGRIEYILGKDRNNG